MTTFKSALTTGLFYGLILGLLSIICIIYPLNSVLKDYILLFLLILGIIISQLSVDISKSNEPFYPVFFSSLITFICFPISIAIYLYIKHNPFEIKLILFGLGILVCFVTAAFTAYIRKKNKNNTTE